MLRTTERPAIRNSRGDCIATVVERASENPLGVLVMAHCFTCTKDLKANVKLARRLIELNWCVVRFDFSGIGQSEGNFSSSNFDTNLDDLTSVCQALSNQDLPPTFLFGHSFGGVAATMVANQFSQTEEHSMRGVISLAAPSDTAHLAQVLLGLNSSIDSVGRGEVEIGGRKFMITREMLDNFRGLDFRRAMLDLRQQNPVPQLVIHSLADRTVDYSNATKLYNLLRIHDSNSPVNDVSLLTLRHSDHLLTNTPRDIEDIAKVIDIWCNQRI